MRQIRILRAMWRELETGLRTHDAKQSIGGRSAAEDGVCQPVAESRRRCTSAS